MMDKYTAHDLRTLFDVSHQTIKNWYDTFAEFLSPGARPEAGRKRLFTEDDVKVFGLVAEYRKRGLQYEDAYAALRTGQRGEIPHATARELATVPPALLHQLQEELRQREELLRQAEIERYKAVGQAELLKDLLKTQLAERDTKIQELYEEIGRLKARLNPTNE